jgi:hypothetical protein
VALSILLIYRVRDWRAYIYGFFAGIFAFSPMILFEIRHGFMALKSGLAYIGSQSSSSLGLFESKKILSHNFDFWNNFYNTFTFEFGWIPWSMQMNALYIFIPFVVLGLLLLRSPRMKQYVWFCVLMPVITWVGYLFLNNTVWDYYLTHTRVAYIVLFSFAMLSFFHERKQKIAILGCVFSVLFLLIVATGSAYRQYVSYSIDLYDMNVIDKIKGKQKVIDMLYNDSEGKPFSVFVFVPGIYTYAYDYLFATYGKSTYGYVPGNEKKGLVFLIIEPDMSQPWRHKGWLETVVQGGDMLWEKTVLNGITIQKKIYP